MGAVAVVMIFESQIRHPPNQVFMTWLEDYRIQSVMVTDIFSVSSHISSQIYFQYMELGISPPIVS